MRGEKEKMRKSGRWRKGREDREIYKERWRDGEKKGERRESKHKHSLL